MYSRKCDEMVATKNIEYKRENESCQKTKGKLVVQAQVQNTCQETIDLLKKKKSRLEKQIEDIKQNIEERFRGWVFREAG